MKAIITAGILVRRRSNSISYLGSFPDADDVSISSTRTACVDALYYFDDKAVEVTQLRRIVGAFQTFLGDVPVVLAKVDGVRSATHELCRARRAGRCAGVGGAVSHMSGSETVKECNMSLMLCTHTYARSLPQILVFRRARVA